MFKAAFVSSPGEGRYCFETGKEAGKEKSGSHQGDPLSDSLA
jgi:hypothetical protein